MEFECLGLTDFVIQVGVTPAGPEPAEGAGPIIIGTLTRGYLKIRLYLFSIEAFTRI